MIFSTYLALCILLLIIPVSLVLIHTVYGSGLWHLLGIRDAIIVNNEESIGILANLPDNLVYTSHALQNKIGFHLVSNIYTTEPNRGILFNLYFFLMGGISNLFHIHPLASMTVISFFAAPLVGSMVFLICRQLKLDHGTSILAVGMVLFGSGPSWVLVCTNSIVQDIGIKFNIDLTGSDFLYSDLFPVVSFLIYPYQSFALVCQSVVLAIILKALRADLANKTSGWIFFSAAALALYALIRPYEAFVFGGLFPLTMLMTRMARGRNLLFRVQDYLIVGALVGPCLGYIIWIPTLPAWRSYVHDLIHLASSRKEMIIGFSVFWVVAVIGVARAFKDRRMDMWFLCLWVLTTVLLFVGVGVPAYKLAGGAVIAYGILGAFGAQYLLHCSMKYPVNWCLSRRTTLLGLVAIAAAICLIGTSVYNYQRISYLIPRVDTEIVAAAALIREENPNSIPVVLTDCSTALLLPGLAGARVYSTWDSETPDFVARCKELAIAGFPLSPPPWLPEQSEPASIDEGRLRDIIAKTKPDFFLVKRGDRIEQWLLAHHTASARTTGQRWSLLVPRQRSSQQATVGRGVPCQC